MLRAQWAVPWELENNTGSSTGDGGLACKASEGSKDSIRAICVLLGISGSGLLGMKNQL